MTRDPISGQYPTDKALSHAPVFTLLTFVACAAVVSALVPPESVVALGFLSLLRVREHALSFFSCNIQREGPATIIQVSTIIASNAEVGIEQENGVHTSLWEAPVTGQPKQLLLLAIFFCHPVWPTGPRVDPRI